MRVLVWSGVDGVTVLPVSLDFVLMEGVNLDLDLDFI